MSTKLATQVGKTAGISNGMRTATITNTAPVTIFVAGGSFSSGVGVLGSYVPNLGDTVAVFRQDSSWLILGDMSAFGGTGSRRVGTSDGTSDGAATSGTTESAYDVVSANVIAGRTYHVKCYFPFVGSVAADRFLVRLREGSGIGGAQITYASANVFDTAGVYVVTPESDWVASATGLQSFVVTAQRTGSGTGTLTPKGATSQTRLLTVDLIEGA